MEFDNRTTNTERNMGLTDMEIYFIGNCSLEHLIKMKYGQYSWNTFPNQLKKGEVYHRNNDQPARIVKIKMTSGFKVELHWYYGGKRHRSEGRTMFGELFKTFCRPAILILFFHESSNLCTIEEMQFFREDQFHRTDGSAIVSKQSPYCERWYYLGELHREGGPAEVDKDSEGNIIRQKWCINGTTYRNEQPLDLPCCIDYFYDGNQ